MLFVAPISTRNQFGNLLNDMGLLDLAVEIGTHRAEFAVNFLNNWKGKKLVCVDPWTNPPGYVAAHLQGGGFNRQQDRDIAYAALFPYDTRASMLVDTSEVAKDSFEQDSIDFVHLDGDHTEPAVTNDLVWWWHRLKPGGMLAGHDIVCPGEPDGLWGRFIQPAVFKFAATEKVDIQLVVEENGMPWSYYMIKPHTGY